MVLGLGLGYIAFMSEAAAVSVIFGLAGLAAVGTGLAGWCGIYFLLKISTCPPDKNKAGLFRK